MKRKASLLSYEARLPVPFRRGSSTHSKPNLQLQDDIRFTEAHGRLLDKVTDRAGRFPSNGSPGMSIGENHNLQLETERRLLKQVAERIETLVKNEHYWFLAANAEIN